MSLSRTAALADHYLRVAGIAAVYVDAATDAVGVENVVGLEVAAGRLVWCCARGHHHTGIYANTPRYASEATTMAAIGARLEDLAEAAGIGLTPHHIAVQRALAAVHAVNDAIDKMQHNGGMKDLNRAFKAARKVDPSLRYFDYLHAHKAAMLEAWRER